MDQQNLGGGGQTGSEDNSEAQRHARNAEENRDALEAQARRTDATTPPDVDQPIRGIDGGQGGGGTGGQERSASSQGGGPRGGRNQGLDASGTGGQGGQGGSDRASEDSSRATAHAENAERNRDSLEAQNRRVEETAPDSTRQDLRDR